MIQTLKELQLALTNIVFTYIDAQNIDLEGSEDAEVNAAETQIRVIANKQVPRLLFEIVSKLNILYSVELGYPDEDVKYILQVLDSTDTFPQTWEQALLNHNNKVSVYKVINLIFELAHQVDTLYSIIKGYIASRSSGKKE